MTLEIELSEPHEAMLEALREDGETDADADIRRLVEDAIHNGYQQLQQR